jgi:hypothetical protein
MSLALYLARVRSSDLLGVALLEFYNNSWRQWTKVWADKDYLFVLRYARHRYDFFYNVLLYAAFGEQRPINDIYVTVGCGPTSSGIESGTVPMRRRRDARGRIACLMLLVFNHCICGIRAPVGISEFGAAEFRSAHKWLIVLGLKSTLQSPVHFRADTTI